MMPGNLPLHRGAWCQNQRPEVVFPGRMMRGVRSRAESLLVERLFLCVESGSVKIFCTFISLKFSMEVRLCQKNC